MRNYYFLEYGSSKCVSVVENDLEERFKLEFNKHGDHLLGSCINYSGKYADQMLIKQNLYGEEWQYPEHKEYETIVAISFVEGRDKEKINKIETIKKWFTELEHVQLLKEETLKG
ncbi:MULTISPECIES: hypothetical protein [Carnobacterium]|uniref:hypothetical protein n=1 Tax=Carnobacterium TaxID=2747 RepID=UPI0007F3F11A|nr:MULTISPECIES: hypothetical protein [Carnobacterium]MCO6017676.1 hypothetical protein [Carnobacterium divergens]MDT1938957.1 hypothetical protein [Carnobacterium divergens]MDT1941395.1 hypothetical protein [Carnobacterium divergens]MDT1947193.1 hypothetical protein [Carnobacterium divergens]MDT1949631.1 hypothetical protein [Carnobacterium divergens]